MIPGNAQKVYLGDTELLAVHCGDELLWEKQFQTALPAGYTQLEYIQGTGTQFIDTGYDPVKETVIEIGYEFTSIPSGSAYYYVFGNYNSSGGKTTFRLMTNRGTYDEICVNAYTVASTNGNLIINESKEVGVRYDDVVSNSEYVTNGKTYAITKATEGSSNTRNLALFTNHALSGNRKSNMKLFYCKIREGDTLVRDFMPCLDADGVPCLYDTVAGQTYYNNGTGSFENGATI